MQKNQTGKIVIGVILVLAFIALGIVSIIVYQREPSREEYQAYLKEHPSAWEGDIEGDRNTGGQITSTTEKQNTTVEGTEADTTLPVQPGTENPLFPDGTEVLTDMTLTELAGKYTGTLRFEELSGYETMDGAPDNILQMEEEERQRTPAFTLEIKSDGDWEFSSDSQMCPSMKSSTLKDPKDAENGLSGIEKIREVKDGYFKVERHFSEEGKGEGGVSWDGTAGRDQEGMLIVGTVSVEMKMQNANVVVRGTYSVRPAE